MHTHAHTLHAHVHARAPSVSASVARERLFSFMSTEKPSSIAAAPSADFWQLLLYFLLRRPKGKTPAPVFLLCPPPRFLPPCLSAQTASQTDILIGTFGAVSISCRNGSRRVSEWLAGEAAAGGGAARSAAGASDWCVASCA